jgi:hypothetical protein
MPLYRALRTTPLTERNGQTSYEDGKTVRWHDVTHWPALGTIQAKSAEIALRMARETYGGRPVIEEIPEPIHYVGERE